MQFSGKLINSSLLTYPFSTISFLRLGKSLKSKRMMDSLSATNFYREGGKYLISLRDELFFKNNFLMLILLPKFNAASLLYSSYKN